MTAIFLVLYAVNFRITLVGDSQAHLYQAASLAWSGDFQLDEYRDQFQPDRKSPRPYFLIETHGHLRSIFNFFPATLLAPAFLGLRLVTGTEASSDLALWAIYGKFMASLLVFGAGVLLWLILRTRVHPPVAILTVMAFWLATPLWPTSVDYLQHQPMVFFKLLALWMIFGGHDDRRPRFFLGGLFLAMAVLSRYQILFSAIVLSACIIAANRRDRRVASFIVGGIALLPFAMAYHKTAFGSFFARGPNPYLALDAPFFPTLAALLLSPSKGLFIHSPWLLLVPVALVFKALRPSDFLRRPNFFLPCALSIVPTLALYSKLNGWFGGFSWGYRYLIDILPEMTLLFGVCFHRVWTRVPVRWAVTSLLAISFFIQAIGTLGFDHQWHHVHDLGVGPGQRWLWQVRNSQIPFIVKRGLIYLGPRPVQLWENPFLPRGFLKRGTISGLPVLWTGEAAQYYYVSRVEPSSIWFYPSPSFVAQEPINLRLRVEGEAPRTIELPPNQWTKVLLPPTTFQHGRRVSINLERTSAPASSSEGALLGVAVPALHVELTPEIDASIPRKN